MSTYKTINNVLNIFDVLDALGLSYYEVSGETRGLYEDSKKTDGRRFSSSKKFFNDFSGNRPKGNIFTFVRSYLKLGNKETFKWFKDNFGISDDSTPFHSYKPP